mmetsp:Transcript_20338/g.3309  ORF Transcript_20338/g.3309 Transcript_20338/m.3309 type:complete len:121 (-) Transcript_20338:96-458(-)
MNPPIIAALIALPFGLIPYMKEYVWCESGAVFTKNLFAALQKLGGIASPIIIILLGSSLSYGYPPEAKIQQKHIWLINLGKLVIMPIVGIALVVPMYNNGVIDVEMAIMVLICYATPTSM